MIWKVLKAMGLILKVIGIIVISIIVLWLFTAYRPWITLAISKIMKLIK